MESTITAVIIPIVTAICTVSSFIIGRVVSTKKEAKRKGHDEGEIKSDIEYIKIRVDSLYSEQHEMVKNYEANSERITRCEESAKQAHKRIDRLESLHDNNNRG